MEIRQCVEVSLRTEQLFLLRMLFFLQTSSILSVRILVKIFQIVSSRIMGLVLSMSLFQSELFGIGTMLALFHTCRVFHLCITWLKSIANTSIMDLGLFSNIHI